MIFICFVDKVIHLLLHHRYHYHHRFCVVRGRKKKKRDRGELRSIVCLSLVLKLVHQLYEVAFFLKKRIMCIKPEEMVIVLNSDKYLSDQPIVWPDMILSVITHSSLTANSENNSLCFGVFWGVFCLLVCFVFGFFCFVLVLRKCACLQPEVGVLNWSLK